MEQKPNPKQDQAREKGGRPFLRDDLPLIRKALITLGVSLALSAAAIGASQTTLHEFRDGMNLAQAQRNEARNKLLQAETERREILDYQPKYIALREREFIGEEKRLDWIEQIRQIREKRKLLPIVYEISAQRPIQANLPMPPLNLELRGSKIRLGMDLLHELDLLNFLDDLKSKGSYTVRECAVKRLAAPSESPRSPRLAAECTLYWLTLGERTASAGKPANQ